MSTTAQPDSSSAEPFVSIVVSTFRRPDVLRETLAALTNIDYPAHLLEIIVVDDGSGDETPQVVQAFQHDRPALRYHEQANSGVATARNNGARTARGEVLIFLDDDIVVEPDVVRRHLAAMDEFGACLVNGHWEFAPSFAASLRATPFGRFRIGIEDWVKDAEQKRTLRGNVVEPSSITACNLGVRREDYWRIGGFDEQFPFAGREDQEFSIRAAAAGFRFIYDYDMRIWHNDHRLSFRQFCERKRRDALTLSLLALKYPERWHDQPMVTENKAIGLKDSPKLMLKKALKRALSTPPCLALAQGVVAATERAKAGDRVLHKLYWSISGLYIYAGFREGLRRFGGTVGVANGRDGMPDAAITATDRRTGNA